MDADARRKQLSAALNRVASGDRAALRLVYDMTAAKLFGVCLRILNDRSEAEDVLQDVYITVWRKAGAFDATRASPITWLVAIARNRSIDCVRSTRTSRLSEPIEAAESVSDPMPLASDLLEAEQQTGRLESAVSMSLRPANRRQSVRPSWTVCTYEALAARAGVPLGTMKSWIRRGLAKLRECLER